MPEASNCVKVSHKMVDTPNAVAPMPALAQGETDDKPKPVPRINKINDNAAAAAAPAKMADHDTAPLAIKSA